MKTKLFNESGQALIVIAIAAIGLFALLGLAIDGSALYSDHRHAQNAADTAALAGSLAKVNGDTTWKTTALDRALSNGYNGDLVNNTVTVSACDETGAGCGPYQGNASYVKVVITSDINTFFAKVIGVLKTHNRVESLAMAQKTASGGVFYSSNSVWSTKSSGSCNGTPNKALATFGSGHLQLYGGGMGSAMPNGSCIDFSGAATQFYFDDPDCGDLSTAAASIPNANLSNYYDPDNCSDIVYNATFSAPPANLGITCSGTATKSGSSMSPGNYTGSFPPSGVTTLQAGTYCINGDFKLNNNQTLTGNGVTIVMNSGLIKWNGGSSAILTAPTTGTYKGLLIYYPPSNHSDLTLDGNGSVTMTGTVLAQNAPCYYAGTGNVQKQTIQFICYTWQGGGNNDVQIVYDSSMFYNQVIPAQVGLMQ